MSNALRAESKPEAYHSKGREGDAGAYDGRAIAVETTDGLHE